MHDLFIFLLAFDATAIGLIVLAVIIDTLSSKLYDYRHRNDVKPTLAELKRDRTSAFYLETPDAK